ncbi:phosphoglycerate mutase [Cognatiluteimonas weifangensis]|uniref:Phosphoglycerate mutase n=1 Tax=Cognatiluteimonas weifangensis TaxID=2303539 RepID=A0A372DNX1_9GAMM|nr:phosphoglycerate mutase [Luteimonas weifangensis]RFP61236.1 phosphoglycerate mutase [Luteimonas weifangensis]
MASATLLLPARTRLVGAPLPETMARALGRADRLSGGEPGERAQLLRHFQLLPRGWPAAALTRQMDVGDAAGAQWLRADPAWVRPDINGARLFACAEGMQLVQADVDALLPALRPLFGDLGFPIDAPNPARWYLRLPPGTPLPVFVAPEDALGADLLDSLDATTTGADAVSRRWRVLLNEAQVVLHTHPWNERRVAAGKPPVNSLWFWGGGQLPDHVSSPHAAVQADDTLLRALAAQAGLALAPYAPRFRLPATAALCDLRELRDPDALCADWLAPALDALRRGELARLQLDFADGEGYLLLRPQRWRWWRRPVREFAAAPARPTSA